MSRLAEIGNRIFGGSALLDRWHCHQRLTGFLRPLSTPRWDDPIAFSLGYPDGQRISREEMVARIARIARAVKVPVTADAEWGYGSTEEEIARTTREVIEAGAVGMNLEDTSGRADQPLPAARSRAGEDQGRAGRLPA